jgi:hypothetical protein
MRWFDETTGKPCLDEYVQEMDAFQAAMQDGRVDQHELDAQEDRLVAVMRAIEPQLDDRTHALVTELICELSCYSLLETIRALQQAQAAANDGEL